MTARRDGFVTPFSLAREPVEIAYFAMRCAFWLKKNKKNVYIS